METQSPEAMLREVLKIVGSEPTALDLRELHALRATGIRDGDTLWRFYVALQVNRHNDRKVGGQIRALMQAAQAAFGKTSIDDETRRRFLARVAGGVGAVVLVIAAAVLVASRTLDTMAAQSRAEITTINAAWADKARQVAEDAATRAADSAANVLKEKFAAELNANVQAITLKNLKYAEDHKAEVDALLRAETRTPGVLKFALSPEAADMQKLQAKAPGIFTFMKDKGEDAMRLYNANPASMCIRKGVDATTGRQTCTIFAPRNGG